MLAKKLIIRYSNTKSVNVPLVTHRTFQKRTCTHIGDYKQAILCPVISIAKTNDLYYILYYIHIPKQNIIELIHLIIYTNNTSNRWREGKN